MFLSKVPAGQYIAEYDVSGEWVKFYTLGVKFRREDGNIWIDWLPQRGERVGMIYSLPLPLINICVVDCYYPQTNASRQVSTSRRTNLARSQRLSG